MNFSINSYDNWVAGAASKGYPSFIDFFSTCLKSHFIFSWFPTLPYAAGPHLLIYAKVIYLFFSSGCKGHDSSCRQLGFAHIF